MIEHNDVLSYALKASPSTLYDRYGHYGDLGVLGWCNDFSELIEAVKVAGHGGYLFTSTRDDGLEACEEILKLELDVKLQFVLLYLSSLVGRLRHFLDGEPEDKSHSQS